MKAATSSYSATSFFAIEFLQYIYSVLVAKNHQKIQSRCLVHEFSFTDIFFWFRFIWLWLFIAIMKRCAERYVLKLYCTSLSIFILFQLQSWIILRVRTKFLVKNFHMKRVIMEIFNNCISGRLNNNYKWKFQPLLKKTYPSVLSVQFEIMYINLSYICTFVYSITTWKNTYLIPKFLMHLF